jgi:hypothetical protein
MKLFQTVSLLAIAAFLLVSSSARSALAADRTTTPMTVSAAQLPIVPDINPEMKLRLQDILTNGAIRGNHRNIFAKIGDSLTASTAFLIGIGCKQEKLGDYEELAPVIDYFSRGGFPSNFTETRCGGANSFNRRSLAAQVGWTSDIVLERLQNGVNGCPRPLFNTPLLCEIKLTHPAIALVMFGTNDLERYGNVEMFQANMTKLLQQTIDAGVIPVLSTIPPRTDRSKFSARVQKYNDAIITLGIQFNIPVINYWRAMMTAELVNNGLSADGVHPNYLGDGTKDIRPVDFTADGLHYGYNLRNLIVVQTLAKVKTIVIDDGPADPKSPMN